MSRTKGLFRGVFINYLHIEHIEKFIEKGVFCPTVLVLGRFIYFFLSVGIDLGGFSMKYSSKSLIMYDTERSFSFASLSRKVFISSVIRKLKDTDFTSFIRIQCTTLFSCISNIKTLICATHCSTVRCDTIKK